MLESAHAGMMAAQYWALVIEADIMHRFRLCYSGRQCLDDAPEEEIMPMSCTPSVRNFVSGQTVSFPFTMCLQVHKESVVAAGS
jgi:hypothetical protein